MARQVLVKAARGEDPAGGRAEARRMPVLEQAFEDFMAANPKRASRTDKLYREKFARHFADWRERPLDAISRRDVEARFNRLTEDNGWSPANRVISLLRSIVSVRSGRGMGPVKRISHVEARPHKVLSFCW